MYDADRSGCISKEELASMLRVSMLLKCLLDLCCTVETSVGFKFRLETLTTAAAAVCL
jgi:Ca2+-binding EF-hand superfamily protein